MSDVLYSDVQFKNPKRINAKADASTSDDTTYSEVKFPRAQGNGPPQDATGNSASQPVGSKGGSEVTSGRWDAVKVGLGLLCALLLTAVIALTVLYIMQTKDFTDVQTKEKLQMMESENKALKNNLTDIQTKDKQTEEALRKNLTGTIEKLTSCQAKRCSCSECFQGPRCTKPCTAPWESRGGKCYWFSSKKYTWQQSRDDCIRVGADLVKIDRKAEQVFLQEKVGQKMRDKEDKFWIGLTDSKDEGTWLWADDSSLPAESFWLKGPNGEDREPDDWKGKNNVRPEGEDCVRMGEFRSSDPNTWLDAFCDKEQKYICEKQADTGTCEKCV